MSKYIVEKGLFENGFFKIKIKKNFYDLEEAVRYFNQLINNGKDDIITFGAEVRVYLFEDNNIKDEEIIF